MHEQNEVCKFEFDTLKERLDKMEERETKRNEEMNIISKAIVAIQIAGENTAKTLERMEVRMEKMASSPVKKESFWNDDTKKMAFKYATIIIIFLILALVGVNLLEASKNITGI